MAQSTLKRGISNFTLIGTAKVNEFTFELDKVSESGWKYNKMELSIDCGNDNIVYAQMMGGFFDKPEYKINTFYKDKEDSTGFKPDRTAKKQIAWEDRLSEDVLSDVAGSEFLKVGILKDLKGKTIVQKFLTPYDVIAFLHEDENLKDGTKVRVEGNLKFEAYQGHTTIKKEIKKIFLEGFNVKNKHEYIQTILIDSDSFGKYDKERGIFPISAYVPEYISKIDGKKIGDKGETIAFPQTFEIEAEESKAEAIKNLFFGKLMKKPRDGHLDELQIEGIFQEGFDVRALKLEDLNPDIQLLIEVGMANKEDELTKATTGKKRKRMILKKPVFKNTEVDAETGKSTQEQVIERSKYKISEIIFLNDLLDNADKQEEELFTKAASKTDDDFDMF